MIISSAYMKEVMSFKARGKGGFFFGKESKVKKGAECNLTRNSSNQYGETEL